MSLAVGCTIILGCLGEFGRTCMVPAMIIVGVL